MNASSARPLSCLLSLCVLLSVARGQDKPASSDDRKPPLKMNLVPVGDFPVSGAIIKNGFPVMVNPGPTELVPNPLYAKDGKDYKSLSIIMNSPSASWTRPSGSVVDILTKKDDKYSTYLSVTLPDSPEDVTVFMLRHTPSNDWRETPRAVILKNGIESFPLGSVRVVNFSSVPLQATVGETVLTVPSKSFKIFPNPGKQGDSIFFQYEITGTIGGADRQLANTAVSYDKNSRMNLVAYDRDGKSEIKIEGDNQPVKVVKYFELPVQPAPAPAGSAAATP